MDVLLFVEIFVFGGFTLNVYVEELVLPSIFGSFTVLRNHIPILSVLGSGLVKLRSGTVEFLFFIDNGIVEVEENRVVLLIYSMSFTNELKLMDIPKYFDTMS